MILCFALMPVAQSCFTGIESTPRITSADARRAGVKVTQEARLGASILPESPRSWQPGKQWMVTDNRIAMIFTGSPACSDSLGGSVITLSAIKPVVSLTGDSVMQLSFTSPHVASRLDYVTDVKQHEWQSRPSMSIPFTVEMSAVDRADSLLRGKEYYITSPLWCDAQGNAVPGLHHIPVEITGVRAGTESLPLMVSFIPKGFGDNVPARYIYMTYGTGYAASRNFDRLFTFTNPRQQYPAVTEENWNLIVRSKVAAGMSRNEVRLALGQPDNIDRGATRGGLQMERWSYTNGIYLLFEEDVLIKAGR